MSPVSSLFPRVRTLVVAMFLALPLVAGAQEIHIPLPHRNKATPVQKLNQDGVKAIKKHDYEKAKRLFYQAYLLDPNDPFTLNNLGYIAELDGDIDRAQRFYDLAAQQPSQAAIAVTTNPKVKGKEVSQVAGNAADREIQINRTNVYAMGLLMKDRAPEADLALQQALKLDPRNPFTLNNLGFAKEKEGELELALKYYTDAANTGSNEGVVVTLNRDWRGKPISEIASENAKNVQRELSNENSVEARVARLNLRGVSAINRNDPRLADGYFREAYKLDPTNAFTMNNMGYLAEREGDLETADFFYAKAREANRNEAKVVLSTRREMEGQRMGAVAALNDQTVSDAQERELEARRREGGPIELLRRDNTAVKEPAVPVNPTKRESAEPIYIPNTPTTGNEPTIAPAIRPPAENSQPANTNSQPNSQPNGGVIEPLPDNQQPPNADKGNPTYQPNNPTGASPQAQPQQQQPQGQPQMDVIPPLPDNQQPPNAGSSKPNPQIPQTQHKPPQR